MSPHPPSRRRDRTSPDDLSRPAGAIAANVGRPGRFTDRSRRRILRSQNLLSPALRATVMQWSAGLFTNKSVGQPAWPSGFPPGKSTIPAPLEMSWHFWEASRRNRGLEGSRGGCRRGRTLWGHGFVARLWAGKGAVEPAGRSPPWLAVSLRAHSSGRQNPPSTWAFFPFRMPRHTIRSHTLSFAAVDRHLI